MILFNELIMSVRVGALPLDANENIWTSRGVCLHPDLSHLVTLLTLSSVNCTEFLRHIVVVIEVTQVRILFEELRIFGRWQNFLIRLLCSIPERCKIKFRSNSQSQQLSFHVGQFNPWTEMKKINKLCKLCHETSSASFLNHKLSTDRKKRIWVLF